MTAKNSPQIINVLTQNVLLDITRTREGRVLPQGERIDSLAETFKRRFSRMDVVGIQEADKDRSTYQHYGELLAEKCGYGPGFWVQHNQKPYQGAPTGRANEFVGLFGEEVNDHTSIELGDQRRAAMTEIAGVAFVTLHLRAGASEEAYKLREEQTCRLLEGIQDYENAVVLGDFNEPPTHPGIKMYQNLSSALNIKLPGAILYESMGRKQLQIAGFRSAMAARDWRIPKTFPTPDYRGVTDERLPKWLSLQLDDIMIRGPRIKKVGNGVLQQVMVPEGVEPHIAPRAPSDHYGLWAQLEIAPKHD